MEQAARGWTDRRLGGEGHGRLFAVLLLAFLLPTLVFAGLQIASNYRAERRTLEMVTALSAQGIADATDAMLSRTRTSLAALATMPQLRAHDWPAAARRAREFVLLNPDWRGVKLVDSSRRVIFDTTGQDGVTAPPPPGGTVVIGDVARRSNQGVVAVTAAAPLAGDGVYLVATLGTDDFQRLLIARAPREGVSAIADRRGQFVARSRDYAARVGTPGSAYLRAAARRGGAGLYRGVTLEGVESYTAYRTSPATGWSVHIAVPSVRFDRPASVSILATIGAALASVVIAALLGMLVLRAIAARHLAERRIARAQRLEAVGKMTGGVAHDFNNMLAIVIGNLDIARRRMARGQADVGQLIDNAAEGAKRAAAVTAGLLAFSRRQRLAPAALDVNALIEQLGALIARTATDGVALSFDLDPRRPQVLADAAALENALINLVANARDAMPRGGALGVATGIAVEDKREFVSIAVADHGSGMTAEVAERAFDPFFTTKDVGQGTGLGLSQIHGFVEQSGGQIRLATRIGEGTTVTLLLPRIEGAARVVAPIVAGDAPVARPGESILVVEDEAGLRDTAVAALGDLGYATRAAGSAPEALAMIEADGMPSLVFTDIVLPGPNGRGLADAVRARWPALPVLLTSGFEREAPPGDAAPVLRKPYAIDALARAVRAAIDAAA